MSDDGERGREARSDAGEPGGWDPTRPLNGLERSRSAGSRGETGNDAAPEEADDGARPERAARPGAADDDAGWGAEADDAAPPVLSPHLERLAALATQSATALEAPARKYARWVLETVEAGGKLLLCGNGGSAATVEHVAAEYVVRFRRPRRPLPAVALTASGAVSTAAGNDFSFPELFARQIRALAAPGDLVVLHSTSGESENLLRAAGAAAEMGLRTVGLLAAGGGRLAGRVDLAVVVPTEETARAQELHLAIEHAVADRVDASVAEDAGDGGDAGA